MGKGSSKHLTLQHVQGPVTEDTKNADESKQDISWKINKRNTYVLCPGQDSRKAPDKRDPAKTSLGESSVEVGTLLTEDVEGDPPYEIVELGENSTSAGRTTPEYVNYPASSNNDGRFHDLEGKIHTGTGTEDGAECRLSTPYVNLTFLREQGHIPKCKRSGSPDCAAALSIRRHYRELKRRILLESVCDHFIQYDVLQEPDYENIMHGSYARHARVDILLQIMLRKKSQKVFTAFNLVLRKTGFQDLADKLENTEGVVAEKPYVRDWSSNLILNAWPRIETYLKDELQPEYILDFFMQENIFSVDEYEEVFWSMGRRVEMRKTLLEKMKNHLPESLFVLLYALKEVDEENKNMVEELEKLVATGEDQQEASGNCREKRSNKDVHLVTGHKASVSFTVPMSKTPVRAVRLTVEKEGNVIENVEIEIDKYINSTDTACLLEVFLPLTGCEITKSERGCVTIHLRPHSKHALEKLSKFCENEGLENFVLNLLREKDILSTLPCGELCINIQVQYHVGDLKDEDAEELKTDWTKSIGDNWSFLCEELDVQNLISGSIKKTIFTNQETNELEGRAAKDRHEAADYFLKCLLNKGPAGINFLMDALREKNNMKIINRLQKSDPLYQTPQAVKENIIVHFELIVQEIDPSQFKDTFVDRKILDKKFFNDLRENHPRRRDRAALFLREVLNKGNRAVCALLDVMTDMGYDYLLVKLVKDNQLETKQQKKDEMKEDTVMEVSNRSSPEGFLWSCCLNVNVEKKVKDETKQQRSGSSIEKEEPIYMNVPWDNPDEGIGETEEKSVIFRSKQGMGQTNRPVTHPESSLSHYTESVSDKCMTYPRTRESEEAKKTIHSLITSAATRLNKDSGIDISISASDESILVFDDQHFI